LHIKPTCINIIYNIRINATGIHRDPKPKLNPAGQVEKAQVKQ